MKMIIAILCSAAPVLAAGLVPDLRLASAAPPEEAAKPPLIRAERPPPSLLGTPELEIRVRIYAEDSKTVMGAALLEMLTPLPGVGQMYAGSQWWKVPIQWALYGIAALFAFSGGGGVIFAAMAIIATKTWAVTDAILAAHRFNSDLKIELGLVPEDWPEEENFR